MPSPRNNRKKRRSKTIVFFIFIILSIFISLILLVVWPLLGNQGLQRNVTNTTDNMQLDEPTHNINTNLTLMYDHGSSTVDTITKVESNVAVLHLHENDRDKKMQLAYHNSSNLHTNGNVEENVSILSCEQNNPACEGKGEPIKTNTESLKKSTKYFSTLLKCAGSDSQLETADAFLMNVDWCQDDTHSFVVDSEICNFFVDFLRSPLRGPNATEKFLASYKEISNHVEFSSRPIFNSEISNDLKVMLCRKINSENLLNYETSSNENEKEAIRSSFLMNLIDLVCVDNILRFFENDEVVFPQSDESKMNSKIIHLLTQDIPEKILGNIINLATENLSKLDCHQLLTHIWNYDDLNLDFRLQLVSLASRYSFQNKDESNLYKYGNFFFDKIRLFHEESAGKGIIRKEITKFFEREENRIEALTHDIRNQNILSKSFRRDIFIHQKNAAVRYYYLVICVGDVISTEADYVILFSSR